MRGKDSRDPAAAVLAASVISLPAAHLSRRRWSGRAVTLGAPQTEPASLRGSGMGPGEQQGVNAHA